MAEGWGGCTAKTTPEVDSGRDEIMKIIGELSPKVEPFIVGSKHVKVRVVTVRRILEILNKMAPSE